MSAMQDLGSSTFFSENKQKMITVSGSIEQDFYNNRPSYKGMLFVSIQMRNQNGQGFSKDTKVTAKLEMGEAGRLFVQSTNLIVGAGAGFKKAYQTDQTSFDFSITTGQQGFQAVITKNQMQQGTALTEDELLEIACYIQTKAIAVESMLSAFEANAMQFSGQERNGGNQGGGGYAPSNGGYNPNAGNAPAGGHPPAGGGYGNPNAAPAGGGYGNPNAAPANPTYGGATPSY